MSEALSTADAAVALPAPEQEPHRRGAAIAFAAFLVAALPLVLFRWGRYHWFLGDDWDFLSDRSLSSVDDLLRPHAEHWSTIPIIIFRFEWHLFGLHYRPYQVVTMLFHLGAAVLLRYIMRRAGVNPWIATMTAGIFVLFGPGDQNMFWSFQIGMVGSLVFGGLQMVLADHDGKRWGWDALALAFGLAGLASSGIGPVMVGVVGIAVLIRRGWKPALLQTVPLTIVFLAWYAAFRDDMSERAPLAPVHTIGPWFREALSSVFEGFGYFALLAIVFAVVFVAGLVLAWRPAVASRTAVDARRKAAEPFALLVGFFAFHLLTVNSRWFFGAEAARASRYIHVGAFFLLPALAVAIDACVRRWNWKGAVPAACAVLLVPIVLNVRHFDPAKSFFGTQYHRHGRLLVEGLAWSPKASRVMRSQHPNRDALGGPGPTVGWLLDGRAAGKIPDPGELSPSLQREITIRLALAQGPLQRTHGGGTCQTYRSEKNIELRRGDRIEFTDSLTVRRRGSRGMRADVTYRPKTGHLLIVADDLRVWVIPAPKSSFRLCR